MSFVFRRSVHEALWGTESWEVSSFASDPSVIARGASAGKSLHELYPDFPLLVKVIDAHTRLSVQVHPNDVTCRVTGGDPKTEMWCALSDGPIYAGLREGTTVSDVEKAVRSGRFEELLVRHEAHFGDVFYIPGGLVHAIGDGVKIYEVQQSSDTTFRLYDWGRVDADGRPRELHIEKGLKAIDYSLPPPTACRRLETPYFSFSQTDVRGELPVAVGAKELLVLFFARGSVKMDGELFAEGTSVLLPPGASATLAADDASVFSTSTTF